jgi:hypothetical protein
MPDEPLQGEELIARIEERIARKRAGVSIEDVLGRRGRHATAALWREADLVTIEDVAARTRAEVAALKGVGPRTMALLDAAICLEGFSYAAVS